MTGAELAATTLIPIGLGLFAFIEPCAIGATLLFIKFMEGKPVRVKLGQTATFVLVRALFIGLLGASAALIGTGVLALQRAGWIAFGLVYLAIGLLYLTGRAGWLMRSVGLRVGQLGGYRASASIGLAFGLNIPASAAPHLLALLATSASGATGTGVAGGFLSLALFGFALSLPLVVAVLFQRARALLDRLAGLTGRMPRWTGFVMTVLGLWSIWFGLFVSIE